MMNQPEGKADRTESGYVPATLRRIITFGLVCSLCLQTFGCTGAMQVIPRSTHVSTVHPIRYYDLWQMLRRGRGILVGTGEGNYIAGRFVSAGNRTLTVDTGWRRVNVKLESVKYIVNVLNMTQAREGAITGGLLGAGLGFTIARSTNGSGVVNSANRPTRGTDYDPDDSSESAVEDSESSTSESSAGTSPTGSASEESASSTTDETQAASTSESSAGASESDSGQSSSDSGSSTDATQSGSTTSDDESSGSSAGADGNQATQNSNQSSGESTVIISGESHSSGSSTGTSQQTSAPRERTSSQKAWRTFFFSLGFAALGSVIGWTIGKRIRRSVPRVDYILLAPNLNDRSGRTPQQYVADQLAVPDDEVLTATLRPGARFDTPRSARYFEQCSADGDVVSLAPEIGPVIDAREAETFKLFPTVDNYIQASIVRCGDNDYREGSEARYIAVITATGNNGRPEISIQRLSASDVVRLSTQVRLLDEGIVR